MTVVHRIEDGFWHSLEHEASMTEYLKWHTRAQANERVFKAVAEWHNNSTSQPEPSAPSIEEILKDPKEIVSVSSESDQNGRDKIKVQS